MVDDHKKDIAEFRKCADNLFDSSIKSFASNTLPVLEKTPGFHSGDCGALA